MVAERVQRSGRENADLTHARPEHLAQPMRLANLRFASGERRTDGCAEPLREADADRIERTGELSERHAGRGGSVPQAGAVEVQADLELTRAPSDGRHVFAGEHASA